MLSIIRNSYLQVTISLFRKFNNTVQDDLWESLTEAAHNQTSLDPSITVKEIMDTWTLQKGFPVIQVERNYDAKQATFTQVLSPE